MKFFETGVPPIQPEETLEIMAFMEAADLSKARGGAPVALADVTRRKCELTNRLLVGASRGEDVLDHPLVPLVTRVLIHFVVCPFEANHSRPGRRPRRADP